MKKYLSIVLILFATGSFAEVRKPAVAGSFYPANKEELSYQINKFLNKVPSPEEKGDLIALIVPHAGYPYSGQVAAYAYKCLEGRSFDRVILLGASHHQSFDTIALPDYDYFETPLGKVKVDGDFIQKMKKLSDKIVIDNAPHREEHSFEVQLPFLQMMLKDFKIVPVLFGNISLSNCQSLAYVLSYLMEYGDLIIASSDLSHYYPYDLAVRLDNKGIDSIVKNDLEGYVKNLAEGETEACGVPAIITTMLLAPALGANRFELLKYVNSGDVTGDKTKVVGYASIIFSHKEIALSEADKKKLLRIARETLQSYFAKKKMPEFKVAEESLKENRGAFVTLTANGRLRGCIGYIQPIKPLYLAVQEMAIEAAAKDTRFPHVTKTELKKIEIEISALSRLKRVRDISEIEIGRDGLYIIKGENSGLLLPQVAVEWGWGREEFLDQVCVKAGLPEDSWKEKDAILYRFTAEVFREYLPQRH